MIKKVLLIVSFILFTVALPAQDRNVKEEKTGLDTVSLSEKNAQEIGMLQKQLKGLQRLKISGYVQVQWQIGQGEGQPGTFTGIMPNRGRFLIWRVRSERKADCR